MVEHINTKYQPSNRDVVAVYQVMPLKGSTIYQAAEAIASAPEILGCKPVVFGIDRRASQVSVAYPIDLFEIDNLSHILDVLLASSRAGKVDKVFIEDLILPPKMLGALGGPKAGILGVRERLGVMRRPIIAMVLPRGLSLKQYEAVAVQCWLGRADVVLDDPLIAAPAVLDRVKVLSRAAAKVSAQSGELKTYIPLITSSEPRFYKTIGAVASERIWSGTTTDVLRIPLLRDAGMIVRSSIAPASPLSEKAMSTLCRSAGADIIKVSATSSQKEWGPIKESLRWTPASVHEIPKFIQESEDIMLIGKTVHPAGAAAAARAMRQAMEASLSKISLADYAKVHRELRQALGPRR